jgi:glycosyltransferase involved in cell wall biosynthesis
MDDITTSHNAVWITWERQRRNRELAAALGVPLFEWAELTARRGRLARYCVGAYRTLRLVLGSRPSLVFCQNPSIVLALLLLVLRPLVHYHLAVDAHNAGVRPLDGRSRILNWISILIQRQADLTLVSNASLKREVDSHGGSAFVLPDRIPALRPGAAVKSGTSRRVVFICSYAGDEPYREVIQAASMLGSGVALHMTGDYTRVGLDPAAVPQNVVLTGYLEEERYVELLGSADLVMDLTNRKDCLVCGAYEAVALHRPMVLSDTAANREYFTRGCIYTSHDPASLVEAISQGLAGHERLRSEVIALEATMRHGWEAARLALIGELRSRLHGVSLPERPGGDQGRNGRARNSREPHA